MSADHLHVRFELDFSKSDNRSQPRDIPAMADHLRRTLNLPDVEVSGYSVQQSGKSVVDAKIGLLTHDNELSPATKLAYERFQLQHRTLYTKVRFELVSMQYRGESHNAFELMSGYVEDSTLRNIKLNQASGNIFTPVWTQQMFAEGLSDREIMQNVVVAFEKLKPFAWDGETTFRLELPQADQTRFEQAVREVAEIIAVSAEKRGIPLRVGTLVGELDNFQTVFNHYSHSQIALPTITLEDSVKDLASRYDPDEGITMRPSVIQNVLGQVPMNSDNGQWLRYGMFLATQLAVEIIDGKGGTPNIGDLHAELAEEFGATVKRSPGFQI